MEEKASKGEMTPKQLAAARPLLMGQCAGAITDIKPAKEIVDEMMADAVAALRRSCSLIVAPQAKL